ncbi:MAG: acetylxylan esterase [Lachnospiraceae bacterium]|nr:acetylxylan esterase [Lachnospiraceae bacterium]
MKTYNAHEVIRKLAANHTPSMRYDGKEDFSTWQKKARAKLEELLGLPFIKCDDQFAITARSECDAYTRIDFEFQSEEGYFVPCNLLIPAGESKVRPAVICLQGHSTGKHISIGVEKFAKDAASIAGGRDFAVRAVKEGYCAIAMDQRYMGETEQSEKGTPSCLSDNEAMASLLMGRCAIGERVWDIMRLIDVIENHLTDYIEPDKIICMGNSGGGTATFYASCMDERIKLSMPSCSVCTYEASIMAMYHCPCNFVPGIRKYFDMGDLGGLIAARPLVVVCGKEDPIFPLSGVEESFELIQMAYKQLGKEDLCRLVKGEGGHQFYPDDAWPVVHQLFD